jgi:hypothetical protein
MHIAALLTNGTAQQLQQPLVATDSNCLCVGFATAGYLELHNINHAAAAAAPATP